MCSLNKCKCNRCKSCFSSHREFYPTGLKSHNSQIKNQVLLTGKRGQRIFSFFSDICRLNVATCFACLRCSFSVSCQSNTDHIALTEAKQRRSPLQSCNQWPLPTKGQQRVGSEEQAGSQWHDKTINKRCFEKV